MKLSSVVRSALGTLSAAAFLSGCGGNAGAGAPATSGIGAEVKPALKKKTFYFSAKPQSFVVPANVHQISVILRGAAGDRYVIGCPRTDRGARVAAVIPVTPHEKLAVYVGGEGYGANGGFNGGGNGGSPGGSGGGGASDVRVSPYRLRDRVLVAGGGGGQGGGNGQMDHHEGGCGGNAGLDGDDGDEGGYGSGGNGLGGAGGTQTAGGSGGAGGGPQSPPGNPGANDALGNGGAGGGNASSEDGGGGAGGGGGYYGGGGGGSGAGYGSSNYNSGGGGGGGSSYAEPKATHVRFWRGYRRATTDGVVIFSWQ